MDVAFQRDFEWGKFFRTQWSDGSATNPVWKDAGSCYDDTSCCRVLDSPACNPIPSDVQQFDDTSTDYVGYLIKLAVGNGYDSLTNGKICENPFDTGDHPDDDSCSPWSSTYGMFYGDGTYGDITLKVTGVDHDPSLDGNLLFASGSW